MRAIRLPVLLAVLGIALLLPFLVKSNPISDLDPDHSTHSVHDIEVEQPAAPLVPASESSGPSSSASPVDVEYIEDSFPGVANLAYNDSAHDTVSDNEFQSHLVKRLLTSQIRYAPEWLQTLLFQGSSVNCALNAREDGMFTITSGNQREGLESPWFNWRSLQRFNWDQLHSFKWRFDMPDHRWGPIAQDLGVNPGQDFNFLKVYQKARGSPGMYQMVFSPGDVPTIWSMEATTPPEKDSPNEPEIQFWGDVAYLAWERAMEENDIDDIPEQIISWANNDIKTLWAIKYAIRPANQDNDFEGLEDGAHIQYTPADLDVPPYPGVTLPLLSGLSIDPHGLEPIKPRPVVNARFFALLGTPVGRNVGTLFARHKTMRWGRRRISEIQVFSGPGAEGQRPPIFLVFRTRLNAPSGGNSNRPQVPLVDPVSNYCGRSVDAQNTTGGTSSCREQPVCNFDASGVACDGSVDLDAIGLSKADLFPN